MTSRFGFLSSSWRSASYDAVRAGFKKVIFIIKKGNEQDFRNLKSFIDAEIRSLMEKGDIRRSFVETELRQDEDRTVIHIFRNHMIVQTYYIEA